MTWMLDHWAKSTDLGFIKAGKLYKTEVPGKPDSVQQYSSEIKNIVNLYNLKHPVAAHQSKISYTKTAKIKPSDLTQIESYKISKKPSRQSSCESSYPDFCIPSPPPDLNCPDISQKRFTV